MNRGRYLNYDQPSERECSTLKYFVHADSDERLIRRLKKGIITENVAGILMKFLGNGYQNTLKPMHNSIYRNPLKEYADIIIRNNKYNTVQNFVRERC